MSLNHLGPVYSTSASYDEPTESAPRLIDILMAPKLYFGATMLSLSDFNFNTPVC